jgi:DMSO reductase anchor subunit
MTFKDINFSPDDRELRIFSLIWLAGFGVAGAVVAWRGAGWAPALWSIAAAGCAIGLVAPRAMKPVYIAWMVAAFPIGYTVSVVLLVVLYYGVFTAFALAFKAIGRDPLGRSFDDTASTYWVPHRQPEGVERYFKQF